ncbi:methyltransferase domain-containing protein [Kitasatospora sp. NPDC058263]
MTLATDTDAGALRDVLADQLAAAGYGPEWVRAVRAVPRHLFVPVFHDQDPAGGWRTVHAGDPGYLDAVYQDRALTTQVTDGVPTSSSSEPTLMLAMLDALDVEAGNRVLECGTGTGWNAALLAHRLGDANVTTVDVDPELTAGAARHLARAGYRPTVHSGDGAAGSPDHAPFDRFIATCGLQSVPWPWVEQAAGSAVMIVPIGWGLARIDVRKGEAHGRFLPQDAYFMARRTHACGPRFGALEGAVPNRTGVGLDDLMDRLQFPLSLALPGYRWCTWPGDRKVTGSVGIWTPDGSTVTATADGTVRQTGPRRLWDVVEDLDQVFRSAPDRTDFGLTLTSSRQRAWWRHPDGPGWDLPATVVAG